MNKLLIDLRNQWEESGINTSPANRKDLLFFQKNNDIVIPDDFIDYLTILNGSSDQYDNRFFKFYSLAELKRVKDELFNWTGIPNYKNLVNTMPFHYNCFVFSNYDFHAFSYAIRFYSQITEKNEVYVITGDKYKLIANSFIEFIELYLEDSSKLYYDE